MFTIYMNDITDSWVFKNIKTQLRFMLNFGDNFDVIRWFMTSDDLH